jgi:hypothetical protein
MTMTLVGKQVQTSHRNKNFIDFNSTKSQSVHNISQTNNLNEEKEKSSFASNSTFSNDSNVSYHSQNSCK